MDDYKSKWRVTLTADFDDEASAKAAASDLEEVVGRHNGDLDETTVEEEEI